MTIVYRGDVGARLTIATANATMTVTTVLTVLIKKPNGTVLTKTPTAVDYTTGAVTYDTVAGDVDTVGEYTVQVHGVFDDGDDLRSNVDKFYVNERIG